MTKVACIFILAGLNLYLFAMASFMFFSKLMFEAGIMILILWIVSNVFGYWVVTRYFKEIKAKDYTEIRNKEVDLEWFRDAYLHPALVTSRNELESELDEEIGPSPMWSARRQSVLLMR
jgi:hypothetical protein